MLSALTPVTTQHKENGKHKDHARVVVCTTTIAWSLCFLFFFSLIVQDLEDQPQAEGAFLLIIENTSGALCSTATYI